MFHVISQFFYDDETNNIRVQLIKRLPPAEYETYAGDVPYEIYEAELFLDAGKVKIGMYQPASVDGTIPQVVTGRNIGEDPTTVPENPLPEEP